MNWKRIVCMCGLVLWCTSTVMAGPAPVTNQQEAVTAENTQTVNPAAQISATDAIKVAANQTQQSAITASARSATANVGATSPAQERGGTRDVIVATNPYLGDTYGSAAQDFLPPYDGYDIYTFSDFTTAYDFDLGTYSCEGFSNTGVDGTLSTCEIWNGLPWAAGAIVLSATGTDTLQSTGTLDGDFGGATLLAGSYWITIYATRDYTTHGQSYNFQTDVVGLNDWHYNPGGAFGFDHQLITGQGDPPPLRAVNLELRGDYHGAEPVGACCDPCTGICNDPVGVSSCQLPLLFTENTDCDDLVPLCSIIDGACCINFECTDALCEVDCLDLQGHWQGAGTTCALDPCDENPCVVRDVIYDNGPNDTIDPGSLSAERRLDGGLDRWVVDDVFFATPVTVTDLHWWVAQQAAVQWNGTDDFIILNADGFGESGTGVGGPGTVAAEGYDVANFRIPTGVFQDDREIFVYGIDGLNIELPPGEYWFGMRPIQPTSTGQFFWATAADNGTDDVWVNYADMGSYWRPGIQVFGEVYQNVAFCVTGTVDGPEPEGACCNDWFGTCSYKFFSNCDWGSRFEDGVECGDLDPACGLLLGACCDGLTCTDTIGSGCWDFTFYPGEACATFQCPGGACCRYDPDECAPYVDAWGEYGCTDTGGVYYDGEECVPNFCPEVLYDQPVEGTSAWIIQSDVGAQERIYDNFFSGGLVKLMDWTGCGGTYDGGWDTCDNWPASFEVVFYGMDCAGGLDIDTDDFIGHCYNVIVGASQGGDSTRIETFVPVESNA